MTGMELLSRAHVTQLGHHRVAVCVCVRERERERSRERERERERERVREREREREREKRNKYRGSREVGDIQRAMIMRCSSAGGTHSVFVRAVDAVATFLLLLTCPAQNVQEVRLRIECFWASSGV